MIKITMIKDNRVTVQGSGFSVSFEAWMEVTQTGETCPVLNLNMGTQHGKAIMSSSCGVGRREKLVAGKRGRRNMKTWHALELPAQKQYTSLPFSDSSLLSSISANPSLQIRLRAPWSSHDSLDVWSWGNNSPQDRRDNGVPASTPVHSSSRPCVTWECPSTRLSLLWSVTGCSASHWYASQTWPHTSRREDKRRT